MHEFLTKTPNEGKRIQTNFHELRQIIPTKTNSYEFSRNQMNSYEFYENNTHLEFQTTSEELRVASGEY